MAKKYPRTLSSGANNTVIALSETEAGKLFFENTRSEIGSEAEKMKFANRINSLVVKFVRLDLLADDTEVLVMERLYPIDFRAFEFERRQLIFEVFEDELAQLHKHGFVHRDLRRPSDMPGFTFDNIFLTDQGIRLIDVGISALRSQVGDKLFDKFVEQEINELKAFESFFINR
jgi:tRNA A-37 threonylcarbamoyl transferase component Bud32